jgi:hypothetical protein
MANNKPSWIDYLNLALTVAVGAIGIYVSIQISKSADRLSQNSLVVESAAFLLDDSPMRRQGGVQIVSWLRDNNVQLPSWEETLFVRIASESDTQAPSHVEQSSKPSSENTTSSGRVTPSGVRASAANTLVGRPTDQQVANQLFAVIGGSIPRVFIEIADADQKSGAEALRNAMGQIKLNGQPLVVPGIEYVTSAPQRIQLRFLKSADRDEANALAVNLTRLLGLQVGVRDLSQQFEKTLDVKRRTYELWFPRGQVISPQ